jgi:hypothetical protein
MFWKELNVPGSRSVKIINARMTIGQMRLSSPQMAISVRFEVKFRIRFEMLELLINSIHKTRNRIIYIFG